MNIAAATLADAQGIATVHVRSWQAAYADIFSAQFLESLSVERRTQQWKEILGDHESSTLVARISGDVVGFVNYGQWRNGTATNDDGEIWALYAKPEFWGKGIGRNLLDSAVCNLRAAGRHRIFLWVANQNESAMGFYSKYGFEVVDGTSQLFEVAGQQVEEVCLRLGQ